MNEYPHLSEMPIGLGMALMQNKAAMDFFSSLSERERQRVIDRTHAIRSRDEMRAFVSSLPGSGQDPAQFPG